MNTVSFFNPRFTSDLFDVIDRNLSSFENDMNGRNLTPRVDVAETKNQYTLEMELPGMDENDVEINLKDRVLSIASTKKVAKEEKAEAKNADEVVYLVKERRHTAFTRSFTLPEDIDSEKVTASFKNGLLSVTIPRRAETQSRRIAIGA